MTETDQINMQKMLYYLADKVEKLEKERCKCNDNEKNKEALTKTLESKSSSYPDDLHNQKFVTNYDEDDECVSCSA